KVRQDLPLRSQRKSVRTSGLHRLDEYATYLPAPHRGGALARGRGPTGPRARGRLAGSVEQFFEDDGVIARFIFRSEEQSQALALIGELVEAAECRLRFGMREFLQILLAEFHPLAGPGVIPAAQFVGRRQIAQPFVERSGRLAEAARPEAIDQHTRSVGSRCRLIDSLDHDRHERTSVALLL